MNGSETYVHVLPEHFGDAAEAFGTARALEFAVLAAVGVPGAVCEVTEAWVVVRDGRQAWHAETPPETAEMLADTDAYGGDSAWLEAVRDAAGMGLCDFRLEWREGLPPGTEG